MILLIRFSSKLLRSKFRLFFTERYIYTEQFKMLFCFLRMIVIYNLILLKVVNHVFNSNSIDGSHPITISGKGSTVVNKTIYIAVGLKRDGLKEVLGLSLGKNESSSFWMSVLTDIKARGTEDILITATDNLNGFTDSIRTVFPESKTQICVFHQLRSNHDFQ